MIAHTLSPPISIQNLYLSFLHMCALRVERLYTSDISVGGLRCAVRYVFIYVCFLCVLYMLGRLL
jgi:hypothetical protein